MSSIIGLFLWIGAFSPKKSHQKKPLIFNIDSHIVAVTVVDEAIIHVRKYLKQDSVDIVPEFVTVLNPQDVEWTYEEHNNNKIIETKKVKVTIDGSGVVTFMDQQSRKILAELKGGAAFYNSDTTSYEISQAFEANGEGLYGLGQYQNGLMNWKNVPLRLEQFNQEIAIPFLVSTNNYGLLWNNYSITDFNYPENKITLGHLIDSVKNIRKGKLRATETGYYYFFADSPNPERNRKNGPVILTVGGDTVIHYSTVWVPDTHSGKIYLEGGKEYEVLFQNTNSQVPGKISYNKPDFNRSVFSSRHGKAIDYYFVYGDNIPNVIANYQRLTGEAPLYGKWAYGFWQCRERYYTQQELLESARGYRERDIPIDNMVQDWNYWPDDTWGPQWDRKRYPDPRAMTRELDSMNLQLMVSVWPHIRNSELLRNYHLTHAQLGDNDNLDFYDPDVRNAYYRMLSDSMFQLGVSAIWLDGTEPETKPDPLVKTVAGPFREVANTYSLVVTKAMYDGFREEFPRTRVFNLTRSAFAGQQRYAAASWSGDVAATWEQFAEQIPAGLNFSMAGIPYWTTDIGGFFRDSTSLNPVFKDQYTDPEFIELMTRWFQFGTFNPLFRIHGFRSKTEIWRYGNEFENIARKYINLRYQLMPYIYSEAWKVTNTSELLMRPLVYDFQDDENTWEIADQYMFGENIMVCPVTSYHSRAKEVYLPRGNWYNYWTGQRLTGGKKVIVNAPLDQIPLFVKEGGILPLGPPVQYASEATDEPYTIMIFPGKDANYELYFDDNESYDYEEGNYSLIALSYKEKEGILELSSIHDEFVDFEKNEMTFSVLSLYDKGPQEIIFNGDKVLIQIKNN
jgi:alpha-D-xyloside xylohydrolase